MPAEKGYPDAISCEFLRSAGWVPCSAGQEGMWGFAECDEDDRVAHISEKEDDSAHAAVGVFGFASFELFESSYSRYYTNGRADQRAARIIAPIYNQLIADGLTVRISRVPKHAVHPLMTTAQIEQFASEGAMPPRQESQIVSSSVGDALQ